MQMKLAAMTFDSTSFGCPWLDRVNAISLRVRGLALRREGHPPMRMALCVEKVLATALPFLLELVLDAD